MTRRFAFGITAATRPDAARLAAGIGELAFEELWVNDTRRADGLATLAAMAIAAPTLRLAVGVVALTEHDPERIASRVAATGLGPDRLVVGVGSGDSRSLALVRDGVAALRGHLPQHEIAVAAVGPRMAALAGAVADAVVANWALPERLAELREIVADAARDAARPPPRLVAYVRTTYGAGARERLRDDMSRYARYGAHYARAFEDQGDRLVGVAIESGEPSDLGVALEPYRAAADTVVVRAIPATDTAESWLEIARAASGGR